MCISLEERKSEDKVGGNTQDRIRRGRDRVKTEQQTYYFRHTEFSKQGHLFLFW